MPINHQLKRSSCFSSQFRPGRGARSLAVGASPRKLCTLLENAADGPSVRGLAPTAKFPAPLRGDTGHFHLSKKQDGL
jgi:hypothetical protein